MMAATSPAGQRGLIDRLTYLPHQGACGGQDGGEPGRHLGDQSAL